MALLLALFLCSASAQLCLMYPPQRGPLTNTDLRTPGNANCNKMDTAGVCGGTPTPHSVPLTEIYAGKISKVVFQQNIDFLSSGTGAKEFRVEYTTDVNPSSTTEWVNLGSMPDDAMSNLTTFVMETSIPLNAVSDHAIVRVSYIVKPGVTYVQCSDVIIKPWNVPCFPDKSGSVAGLAIFFVFALIAIIILAYLLRKARMSTSLI